MELPQNNFGARLRGMIERKGITIGRFSADLGIGESQAFNWLKSATPPPAKHWSRLCDYFGVTQPYLIAGVTVGDSVGALPEKAEEEPGSYNGPALEQAARRHFEDVIAAAKSEPARLGWIVEQLQAHVAIPPHWRGGVRLGRITPQSETAQPLPIPSRRSRSA